MGTAVNMVSGGLRQTTDAGTGTPQAVFDQIKAVTSPRKVTTPEDVAGAMLFFASPRAAAGTGQQIVVVEGLAMN